MLRRLRYHAGIGTYLTLAFCGLAVILSVVVTEVIGTIAARQAKHDIGIALADLARQTADKLDRGMQERYREVRLMARRPDLTAPASSVATRRAVLNDRQSTFRHYAWIGLAGLDGRVIAATQGMLEGADVSVRPWFRNALVGNYVGDVHDAKLLARLLPAPNGEPKRFVDIAFPYLNSDGKPAGVLGVHLSWQWAREVRDSVIGPEERPSLQAIVASSDGTILLGPDAMMHRPLSATSLSALRTRANGYLVEYGTQGNYLVGFARTRGYRDYPGLGWSVVVRQDLREAYGPVRTLQARVLWIGVGAAVVFSILGHFLALRLSRPLRELALSAERIRDGRADAIAPPRGAYAEVHGLAGTLNALVAGLLHRSAELDDLNRTLERRVAERTDALQEALARARADELRIQTIIASAPDAFIAVDIDGRIRDWNPAAQRTFGWQLEEVAGRSYIDLLVPPRHRARQQAALAGLRHDGTLSRQRFEWLLLDRRGAEIAVEVTVGFAEMAQGACFGVFIHDISERKRIERMKTEFISTVSHELRTPMTSINASLAMLSEGMAGELAPDVRKLIDIACQSTERMIRLVNDMLDMEKIEAGLMEFDIRAQPLAGLVRQAVDTVSGSAAAQGVRIVVEDQAPGAQALADHDRIIQVFVNLLSNAIKFSPPAGTVTVVVEAVGRSVSVAVFDQGKGIPTEFQDRIFQKFAQADSSDSRRREGTGLGLSICREIVRQHGGDIGFMSAPQHGTRFYVELPAP
jgi:PAS domain S-box-containing protein